MIWAQHLHDIFHSAILFLGISSAVLGWLLGAAGRKPGHTITSAVAGGIFGILLGAAIDFLTSGPEGGYVRETLMMSTGVIGVGALFFVTALLGGILGAIAGVKIIDLLKTMGTHFSQNPTGYSPHDPAGALRRDTIEAPNVREATQKLQESRYTVINIKKKATGGGQEPLTKTEIVIFLINIGVIMLFMGAAQLFPSMDGILVSTCGIFAVSSFLYLLARISLRLNRMTTHTKDEDGSKQEDRSTKNTE